MTYRPVGLYILWMISTRDQQAEATRIKILNFAAEEVLRSGFQSASVGEIIYKAGVSKGCFYHHFPTKRELGYAVLDEMFTRVKKEIWEPILTSENPLESIINMFEKPDHENDCESIKHGCPINNLAQEMSPIDEGFRERIEIIYLDWKERLTESLQSCQKKGYMNNKIQANEIATLIMAVTQGATGIAKNSQQPASFTEYTRGLSQYLRELQTGN